MSKIPVLVSMVNIVGYG